MCCQYKIFLNLTVLSSYLTEFMPHSSETQNFKEKMRDVNDSGISHQSVLCQRLCLLGPRAVRAALT